MRIDQELVNKTEKKLGEKTGSFIKARNKEGALIVRKIGSEMWQKYIEKVQAEQKKRKAALDKRSHKKFDKRFPEADES
jgi:hypothetical protein